MTLVELLISLSICSALLVALAAAFRASSMAVESNDAYFRSTQAARVTLNQIVTEIRRADAVQVMPGNSRLQVIRPPDQLTPNEIYRQYCYDAPARRVTLQIVYTGNTAGPVYELAADVSACTFLQSPTANGAAISIQITCNTGNAPVTLTGASTPRRAIP